ncbi:hypothetical protein [Psychrobacter sp. JCM 18900]|nr:hypothetical protein [Psychrobacter sp. JCM 18900]
MGFEPSEPQMVIGSLMETALPAFEQVLFDKARPSVASITNNAASTTVNILPDSATNLSVDEVEIAAE